MTTLPLVQAQQKNYVVEKVVNKELPFSPNESLKIIAEKASVKVSGWEKKSIRLRLTLAAKSATKAIAEKEINYLKYGISKEKNILSLTNAFAIPIGVSGIQSSLEVLYELTLPFGSSIEINNKYGDITLTDLKGDINLTIEFGDIHLHYLEAQVRVQSSYGQIRGHSIDGSFYCKSDKSDIYLENLKGVQTFQTSYGNIYLAFKAPFKGLNIKANRTAVVLNLKNFEENNYDLHTTHADIYLPERFKKYLKKNALDKASLQLSTQPSNPLLKVNTTFSPITLQFNL
jgi:hypothetical protein